MLFAPTMTDLHQPQNTRNNEVYSKVQKEVEKWYTGSSNFPRSTGQMQTKF